ncbi:MAG: hypothetical protein JWO87_329 [Phycisphaerales bacterium]|nr:hypothetical protein [Phycisphaerales bacterium]
MAHQASALERILQPAEGDLSPEVAEYVLRLEFPPQDHARYQELSLKAQEGSLTVDEKTELEDLLTANDVLTLLQSKARLSLKRHIL